METISQETRMISEKEFQHVAEDAQVLGLETREEIKNRLLSTNQLMMNDKKMIIIIVVRSMLKIK